MSRIRTTPLATYGMVLAHLGVAVFTIGVTLTSAYSIERDLKLNPGQDVELAGYQFRFIGTRVVNGPNYEAFEGLIQVSRGDRPVAELFPQKRTYRVQQNPMTEAAIDANLFRDLYVALGEPIGNTGAWAVRIYYKPFVRWIWLGPLLMAIGGLLATFDRRYRIKVRNRKTASDKDGLQAA
jgi:cytochrome c-type biogenesis protein CcmF